MKTKRYRIGRQPHFTASGVLLGEGAIVEIPEDQQPAPGWDPVESTGKETKTKTKTKIDEEVEEVEVGGVVLKKGRAADRKL